MNPGGFRDDKQGPPLPRSLRLLPLIWTCTSFFQGWVQGVLWVQELESLLCRTSAHLPHALHRPARLSERHRNVNYLGQWDSGHWLGQDTLLEVPQTRTHPQRCQEHGSTTTANFSGHRAFKGWTLRASWLCGLHGSSLSGFSKPSSSVCASFGFFGFCFFIYRHGSHLIRWFDVIHQNYIIGIVKNGEIENQIP